MARADRLFRLLTALRMLPQPVAAARLAGETGVSERTLYRDIDALRAGGALIDGAAGVGYVLTEDKNRLGAQAKIQRLSNSEAWIREFLEFSERGSFQ